MFRADFHTHTIMSDGGLLPSELLRRAKASGHSAIAITDHADHSNMKFLIKNIMKLIEDWEEEMIVIPGVELTHIPPKKIPNVKKRPVFHRAF